MDQIYILCLGRSSQSAGGADSAAAPRGHSSARPPGQPLITMWLQVQSDMHLEREYKNMYSS